MPRKFDRDKVINALMNGQLKQAKKLTLEGLTDKNFEQLSHSLEYQVSLLSVGSDDLDTAFNTLAHRVCDVLIRIACSIKLEDRHRYKLMNTYRSLFM